MEKPLKIKLHTYSRDFVLAVEEMTYHERFCFYKTEIYCTF